jgi:hypothetical protein
MVRRAQIVLSAAVTVLVIGWAAAEPAAAREPDYYDLFSNYYVPPGSPAGVGAQLYPSPRPTPPLVGHTYVTYPPFLPQEYLYTHSNLYRTVNPDCSVTWTRICYNHCPLCCWDKPRVMWGRSTPCMPPVKAPTVFCMP